MSQQTLMELLKEDQPLFYPVIPFDAREDRLIQLDFTEANRQLTGEILDDTALFCDYIDAQLLRYQARYGIGGYVEHRTIYSRSRLFDGQPGEEPRRIHLGIDIWGKAGTPVAAPLDGIVHSFARNDRPGDYGATIILRHSLNDIFFHTLYGHLSALSVSHLREGDSISKGMAFAWFGTPAENGQWPPHLHFQVIEDMQGYKGDYPGVCKYAEKEKYLQNCPDPDGILQLNRFAKQYL